MAVLTYSEIETLVLDELVINVTTDAPIATGVTGELGRAINDAYSMIWESSGGKLARATSAQAWTSAEQCTGTVQGILTNVNEIVHLYGTTTAPSALTTVTATSVTLTSAALFGSITGGMAISGTGIPTDTYVASVASTSSLTMTRAATDATSNSRTFSPTIGSIELVRVDLSEIQWLRANASSTVLGAYAAPKKYAINKVASTITTAAAVNTLVLEYWPGVTGYYFPIHYLPQFLPLDATVTTPDVNDIESRDIAYVAAINLAPRIDAHHMIPGIMAKLSESTRLMMDRRRSVMAEARQDR